MKIKFALMLGVLAIAGASHCAAETKKQESTSAPAASASTAQSSPEDDAKRVEGEQRFRANCSRCHAAPHKFPPRMMATIVRHMRVRATITDEDMRLILYYMTQ